MNNGVTTIKTSYMLPKYENPDGYCIFLYKNVENGETLTCKGSFLPKIARIHYEMTGTWEESRKYGKSFSVQSYTEIIENNKESVIAYLSSGVIKGIGKVTAERIFLRFGMDSLKVIEQEPERLLSIKGISPKKLEAIETSYKMNTVNRAVIEFLLPFGITSKQTVKVIRDLKIKSVMEIKEHPYRLHNIHGITIQCVDAIAKKLGIPEDSRERVTAHAIHVLMEAEASGSTGMEANAFGLCLIRSLNSRHFSTGNICEYTIELIKNGTLKFIKKMENDRKITYLYRSYSYEKEKEIAEYLYELSQVEQPEHVNVRADIMQQCSEEDVLLDETQLLAVEQIIRSSVLVVTGGPGTGKTTTIKQAADYLNKHEKGRRIVFMAPSGRAARRIKEATGYEGFTINSMFNLRPGESWEEVNEELCLDNTTIFVDEFSMVGIFLMHAMMRRIRPSCRFILIGDEDQLPSVEAGSVLRDIIASGKVPVVRLEKIHRQNENSMICANSFKIKNGLADLAQGPDFHIVQCLNGEEAQQKMVASYMKYAAQYGIGNIYCIVPRREGASGVKELNATLQAKLNPPDSNMREFKANGVCFRVKDPVMHLKNGIDVANGDIGVVTHIYVDAEDGLILEATYFGDMVVRYNTDTINELALAYAFTVHKSQGSENKIVLTYLSKECGRKMLTRNLLFTAISRGKMVDELYLTNDDALRLAIENDNKEERQTGLRDHMSKVFGDWKYI